MKVTIKVTVNIIPADHDFSMKRTGLGLEFDATGHSTGSDQELTITSKGNLTGAIGELNENLTWQLSMNETNVGQDTSGPHRVFVTYGIPLTTSYNTNSDEISSAVTLIRMEFATRAAAGKSTISAATWSVVTTVGDLLPDGTGYSEAGWSRLDKDANNQYRVSDCITQTVPAAQVLRILGINAVPEKAYATADGSGDGWPDVSVSTCHSETYVDFPYGFEMFPAKLAYWTPTGGENNYEAYIVVDDPGIKAYTVWPENGPFENSKYYALEVLRSVGATQYWFGQQPRQ